MVTDFTRMWHTRRGGMVEVHRKRESGFVERLRLQQADSAGLDHAAQRGRRGGEEGCSAPLDHHPVVRDESRAERHHSQREGGLAGAGGAQNQQSAPVDGHRGGVQVHNRRGWRCRPTHGRMFSRGRNLTFPAA